MIAEALFALPLFGATKQVLGHPSSVIIGWMGDRNASGVHVDENTSLRFSGVWAARSKISSLIAQMPCKVFSKSTVGVRTEETEHSLYPLLHDEPNPDMDSFLFWEMLTDWWVSYGNAYAEKEMTGGGEVTALWPIHPSRIRPNRPSADFDKWIIAGNPSTELPRSDVLNIVGPFSVDGVFGRGVIESALESIGAGMAIDKYRGSFFANDATPPGVLQHPGKLGDTARANMRREWKSLHGGPDNKGNIAVLWEGMTYTKIGSDPEQTKLIESAKFSIEECARWFDLPPHVLKDLARATFSNIDSQQISLVVDCLVPRLVRIEKSIKRQLLSKRDKERGLFIKFIVDGLLRGDPKTRAEVNNLYLRAGVVNRNEVRGQDERNPIPNGDEYFVSQDMIPVSMLIKLKQAEVDNAQNPPEPVVQPAEEPEEPTEIDDEEDARQQKIIEAAEAAVLDVLSLMLRKEIEGVQRAANHPSEFITKLESFYESHSQRFLAAVRAPLTVWLLARGDDATGNRLHSMWIAHSETSKQRLLTAAECSAADLKASVEACVAKWTDRPKELISCFTTH